MKYRNRKNSHMSMRMTMERNPQTLPPLAGQALKGIWKQFEV